MYDAVGVEPTSAEQTLRCIALFILTNPLAVPPKIRQSCTSLYARVSFTTAFPATRPQCLETRLVVRYHFSSANSPIRETRSLSANMGATGSAERRAT